MIGWAEMGPAVLTAAIQGGTAILLAALGELICERSGVLNLGLEGVMLVGALSGFAAGQATGSPWIGVAAALVAGAAMGMVHAGMTVALGGSQVVAGLALLILGMGLTGFFGQGLVGRTGPVLPQWALPGLARLPLVGPILFRHDPLVYAAVLLVPLLAFGLRCTRWGLALRAVGEDPLAADVRGVPVRLIRCLAVIAGGALGGLAGAHLSLAYSPMWIERMVAGRGWIALAVVIFSGWRPGRALAGAYLFGLVGALQFRLQAMGSQISAPLLQTLPYGVTILVLVIIAWRQRRGAGEGAPAALTIPFQREERA